MLVFAVYFAKYKLFDLCVDLFKCSEPRELGAAVSSFNRNENIPEPVLYLKQFAYKKCVPISCYISAFGDINCF